MSEVPVATEDFAGTGALSANWDTGLTAQADVERQSDQAAGDTNNKVGYARWNADAFNDDQYAQIILKVIGSFAQYNGILVRSVGSKGSHDAYFWMLDGASGTPNHCVLERIDNGTPTIIQDFSQAASADDEIKLTAEGSDLKMWLNDGQVGSTETDATYASGLAGVAMYDDDSRADDWEGGNITADGIVLLRRRREEV